MSIKFNVIEAKISSIDFNKYKNPDPEGIARYQDDLIRRFTSELYYHQLPTMKNDAKTFYDLVWYLFFIEGLYSFIIDNIIIYLVINDKISLRTNYNKKRSVKNFEDLEDVSLSCKLKYLEDNGYSEISKVCNKDLRNAIAHHQFLILNDGKLALLKEGTVLEYGTIDRYIGNLMKLQALFNTYYFRP